MTKASLIWRVAYRGLTHSYRNTWMVFSLIVMATFLMSVVTISQVTRDPVVASPQEAVFPAASAAIEYRPQMAWQQAEGLEYLTADGQRQWRIGEGASPMGPKPEDLVQVLGSVPVEPLVFAAGAFVPDNANTEKIKLSGLSAKWEVLDPLEDTLVLGHHPRQDTEIALNKKTAKKLSLKVGEKISGKHLCSANTCLEDKTYRVSGIFIAPHSPLQQFRLPLVADSNFLGLSATSKQVPSQQSDAAWPFASLTAEQQKYPYFIYSFQVMGNTDISPEQRSKLNSAHLRVIAADDPPFWDFEAISFAKRGLLFLPAVICYLLGLFAGNLPLMNRLICRQNNSFLALNRIGGYPALVLRILEAQALMLGLAGSIVGVILGYAFQQIFISPDVGAPHIVLFFLASAAILGVICCVLAMVIAANKASKKL